jgi:hypothetical protein
MKKIILILFNFGLVFLVAFSQKEFNKSVTVPFTLDHNRMLVDAELQRRDGSWRKVRLWVDSGSPEFFISETLAHDLGIDLSAAEDSTFKSANLDIEPLFGVRIGGKDLDFEGVKVSVKFQPYWLFSTMQIDGNLPSSLLKKYYVIFDYPGHKLIIAGQGEIEPKGKASPASINPQTGIIQLDALIEGNSYSFALDMGASFSYISEGKLAELLTIQPEWPNITGTLGCANMWGWWPLNEQFFSVVRIPEIQWGNMTMQNVGIAGFPNFPDNGKTLGEWYSLKTSRPVDGFLGANVLKAYRVEIDYANNCVYFEKGRQEPEAEMDMVGISVRQMPDLSYQVLGITNCKGKFMVQGIGPEDIIISIDGFLVKGATMGTVVDKLRGKPGEVRQIIIDRKGEKVVVNAIVEHYL